MGAAIKNIEAGVVVSLAGQVDYRPGQIVSKTLAQDKGEGLTLFAFEKGEEISTHAAGGDALVLALDGVGKVTLEGREHILRSGEAIVMPAGAPHAVYAEERFKMLLVVCAPEEG